MTQSGRVNLRNNSGSVADSRFSLCHSGLGFLRLRFAARLFPVSPALNFLFAVRELLRHDETSPDSYSSERQAYDDAHPHAIFVTGEWFIPRRVLLNFSFQRKTLTNLLFSLRGVQAEVSRPRRNPPVVFATRHQHSCNADLGVK